MNRNAPSRGVASASEISVIGCRHQEKPSRVANISMRHRPRRRREHTSSERCVLRNERAFAKSVLLLRAREGENRAGGKTKTKRGSRTTETPDYSRAKTFRVRVSHLCCTPCTRPPCSPPSSSPPWSRPRSSACPPPRPSPPRRPPPPPAPPRLRPAPGKTYTRRRGSSRSGARTPPPPNSPSARPPRPACGTVR